MSGKFRDVVVERYESHCMIGYRYNTPTSGLRGIELDGGEQHWPADFLQHRACEVLGMPPEYAPQVRVIDFQ